jgi:hypothetical protein
LIQVEDVPVSEGDSMKLWRAELRQAVDGAATQLQSNLILTLTGIANSGLRHTQDSTRALGKHARVKICRPSLKDI